MDFEIKEKSKVKVGIYGKEYSLTKPTLEQAEDLDVKIKNSKGSESKMMIDFLETLGLPKEASKDMEIEHFVQLVEFLTGSKKK